MIQSRRTLLQAMLAALLACSSLPVRVFAKSSGGADKVDRAIAHETGGAKLEQSQEISLEVPEIAEDGAIVPVTVASTLPDVEAILIFVEKNPTPFAAGLQLDKSLDAYASLRIKMNESCDVIAVVKSGNNYFTQRKKVKVVVGGCG